MTGKHSLLAAFAAMIVLHVIAEHSAGHDNAVIQWNKVALQAVRDTRMGPPMAARALAIVHTAMYDAWAAYDGCATGTQLGGGLRRPATERNQANREAALSYAAYRALIDLFPSRRTAVFEPIMVSSGYDPNDGSMIRTTPPGIGNIASQAVLHF